MLSELGSILHRFIFEKAKELGVRSVVLDGPDSWAQTMASDGIVEKFVGLDFTDADTVFDRCVKAINAIKKVRTGHHEPQRPFLLPLGCLRLRCNGS